MVDYLKKCTLTKQISIYRLNMYLLAVQALKIAVVPYQQ